MGEIFNVGAQHEIAIGDLARQVLMAVGVASATATDRCTFVPYEEAYGDKFDDFQRRVPDTSKLTTYTGWHPAHGLDRMIEDVIASYP